MVTGKIEPCINQLFTFQHTLDERIMMMLLSRRGTNAEFFSYRYPFVVVVENAKKKMLLVFFCIFGCLLL